MLIRKCISLIILITVHVTVASALPILLYSAPLQTDDVYTPVDSLQESDIIIRESDDTFKREILGMKPRRFVFLALTIIFHLYVIPRTVIRLIRYLKRRKQEKLEMEKSEREKP